MRVEDLSVSLDEHRGICLQPIEIIVDDETVEARLSELLAKVALTNQREDPIRDRDTVYLSYRGYIGESARVMELQSDESVLEVGSSTFIEAFETSLLGHCAGETFDVSFPIPSVHVVESIQGMPACVTVTIKSVHRKPKSIDDEYIKAVSEFESVDELRSALREQIEAENNSEAFRYLKGCASAAVAEIAHVDIPEDLLVEKTDDALCDFKVQLQAQGMSLDEYLTQISKDEKSFYNSLKDETAKGIRSFLALREIARIEGITVAEADLVKECESLAAATNTDPCVISQALEDAELRTLMEDSLLREKALLLVIENATLAEEKDGVNNE